MAVNSPIWKGAYELVPQKNSGSIQLGDRVSRTDIYAGSTFLCEASLIPRGVYGSGNRIGWVCTGSSTESLGAGASKLTINWELGGPYANPNYRPIDEWDVETIELNPRVERHVNFQGPPAVTSKTLSLVNSCISGSTFDARQKYYDTITNMPAGDQADYAKKLVDLRMKGVETYYLAGMRYRWHRFFFTLPMMTVGGIIQAPLGPLVGLLPADFEFLRLADAPSPAGVNGSVIKVTSTWLGGPSGHWDTVLYGSG